MKTKKKNDAIIGMQVKVIVDRPKGTTHPNFPDIFYSVNYGYVEGIFAGDDEYQDAYILGVEERVQYFEGEVIAIIHRNNDIEDKWIVVPYGMRFTKEEISKTIYFQEQYFEIDIEL